MKVNDALKFFTENAFHVSETTMKQVHYCTRKFCELLGFDLNTPIEMVFNKRTANAFLRLHVSRSKTGNKNTAAINANYFLRTTQQLFSQRMLEKYHKIPPAVVSFKNAKKLPARFPEYSYKLKKPIIKKCIEECEKLKNKDRDAYLVYWLAINCGLRRKEIAYAQWSWISEDGLNIRPDESFNTKSGKSRFIPLFPQDIKWLLENNNNKRYIISGAKTNRYRTAPDRVAKIIRNCGMTGSKSLHELRKVFGAYVASTQGIFEAQKYLGHHSPDLTQKYYADLINHQPVRVLIK